MHQLSLLPESGVVDFHSHLSALVVRARARGVTPAIAARAERATAANFAAWRNGALDDATARRVRSYFDAVVRRAIIAAADDGARALRLRLVAASIEADLRSAGWDRTRAAAEARRTLGIPDGAGAVA